MTFDPYGCGHCKPGCGPRVSMRDRAKILASAIDAAKLSPPPSVAILVALSEAESGGYAGACHRNSDGTLDRGFMQINSRNAGDECYLLEPCAAAAIKVWQSQGYGAWSTYNGPRYLAALPAATLAARTAGKPVFGGKGPGTSQTGDSGSPCVYGHTFSQKVLGVGPSEHFCLDTLVGGLKMTIGGFGVLVTGLALVWVLSRAVPGAAAASRATSKVGGSLLPPVRTYKQAAKTLKRKPPAKPKTKPKVKPEPEGEQEEQTAPAARPPRPKPPTAGSGSYRPRNPRPPGHRPARRPTQRA